MNYVKVFVTFLDDMERLNFEERGRLITAMLLYARDKQEMELPGLEGVLWPNARRLIDDEERSYEDKCRKNQENAKKGTKKRKKSADTPKNQRSHTNACQEQEKEQEQKQEQEYEQEYFETVVSKEDAPCGAHDDGQNDFIFEGYGEALREMMRSWLTYKVERGQPYHKTGIDALRAQVADAVAAYGEEAVVRVIRQSMAANYHCITFDRLGKEAATPPGMRNPLPSSAAPSPGWRDDEAGITEYCKQVEEWVKQQAMMAESK